jgi:3-hydroxyisobutyrate dehydrogenase-like beta-hydroxyacid dehydrogenase
MTHRLLAAGHSVAVWYRSAAKAAALLEAGATWAICPREIATRAGRMVQDIHSPPMGHIATMLKDLDTVFEVAHDTSTPLLMASLAAQLFRPAKVSRCADADALEIYKLSASTG